MPHERLDVSAGPIWPLTHLTLPAPAWHSSLAGTRRLPSALPHLNRLSCPAALCPAACAALSWPTAAWRRTPRQPQCTGFWASLGSRPVSPELWPRQGIPAWHQGPLLRPDQRRSQRGRLGSPLAGRPAAKGQQAAGLPSRGALPLCARGASRAVAAAARGRSQGAQPQALGLASPSRAAGARQALVLLRLLHKPMPRRPPGVSMGEGEGGDGFTGGVRGEEHPEHAWRTPPQRGCNTWFCTLREDKARAGGRVQARGGCSLIKMFCEYSR